MNEALFNELQKKKNVLRKEKIKFFFSLVTTNALVAMMCISFNSTVGMEKKKITQKILHPHFKMITAPLELFCEYNESDPESAIRLVNKNHQILAQKAYLHGPITTDSKRFKIEISEEDLLKLNVDPNESMVAMPEVEKVSPKNFPQKQRISKYEINL